MTGPTLRGAAQRSYYSGTLTEFCAADRNEIFARMARRNDFDLTGTQRDAWLEEADVLQRVLARYIGAVYLEFTIPRMGFTKTSLPACSARTNATMCRD